ncbi:MAG TPA: hypothetical protein VFZ36_09305 [Vicinamibacterales bacterium]
MAKRFLTCVFAIAMLPAAAPQAEAQYSVPRTSERSIGETYWVEAMGGFWSPTPQGLIQSEEFGIPGSEIDFVDDLDFQKKRFTDFRFVVRPGRKHKLRVQYVPVSYSSETVFERSIVFNGQRYDVGLPVTTSFDWKVWRFGYEWDFVSREKFFVGAILEAKYTQIEAELISPINSEFTKAKGPIPSIGGIARVYVLPNAAITFELSGIKIPRIDDKYEAKYIDWDLYGTFNVTNNFGVTAGYRVMDVMFVADRDGGEMTLKGPYFGAIARF